ncbi:DUF6939 family protein [Leptospirillum ferriphilum]|uniref:DUF6939 family protein n=1 Tax=Leptospirillum ferriphilum TaxID=178606 RepID=UPI0006B1A594|nr:hypothetical protein [Leptospirillum ferriphilum]
MIQVIGPKDRPYPEFLVVNTTSRSAERWSRELSPFYLGPVLLYGNLASRRMENAWQFSKVYREHLEEDGTISDRYWQWAKKGWESDWAFRYPMGKGRKPEFSLWDGERLGYLEARERIYLPLYARSVVQTEAFRRLVDLAERGNVALFDFDSYDLSDREKTLGEALMDPSRKFGHGFVLYGLLTGEIDPNGRFMGVKPESSKVPHSELDLSRG